MMASAHRSQHGKRNPFRFVFLAFVVIAAFFLITEHRAHLLPGLAWLPFALILACPLLHMFHHRGHGGHAADGSKSGDGLARPPQTPDDAHRHGGD